MKCKEKHRNRLSYAVAVVIVIIAGLASRKFVNLFPVWVSTYPGDILWAFMVFLLFGFFCNRISTLKIAGYSILISFGIEITQLYHATWIDGIRKTLFGRLILGSSFSWQDLVCYTLGIFIGIIAEAINKIEKTS